MPTQALLDLPPLKSKNLFSLSLRFLFVLKLFPSRFPVLFALPPWQGWQSGSTVQNDRQMLVYISLSLLSVFSQTLTTSYWSRLHSSVSLWGNSSHASRPPPTPTPPRWNLLRPRPRNPLSASPLKAPGVRGGPLLPAGPTFSSRLLSALPSPVVTAQDPPQRQATAVASGVPALAPPAGLSSRLSPHRDPSAAGLTYRSQTGPSHLAPGGPLPASLRCCPSGPFSDRTAAASLFKPNRRLARLRPAPNPRRWRPRSDALRRPPYSNGAPHAHAVPYNMAASAASARLLPFRYSPSPARPAAGSDEAGAVAPGPRRVARFPRGGLALRCTKEGPSSRHHLAEGAAGGRGDQERSPYVLIGWARKGAVVTRWPSG